MRQPVITAGTIAGLILAGWNVLVAQGLLEGLRPDAQDALGAFVNLFVPIVAAIVRPPSSRPPGHPSCPSGRSSTSTPGTPDRCRRGARGRLRWVRAVICGGTEPDGTRCTNPTTDPSRCCPLHLTRPGFGARFVRTPGHPVHRSYAWRTLAKRTVEAWVASHGWTCPGWRRAAHPVTPGQLAADHPEPLALGGEAAPSSPACSAPPATRARA